MKRWLLLLCALAVSLFAPASSAQFIEVPPLTAPVIDKTGALGPAAADLTRIVTELKNEKGSEIAVLVLPSTKPETIEQYSIRVVEAWKLGRKGIDDGALLLVALEDRTVRIEVGRGLEGDIPDVKAFRIIEEQILPRFRSGDIPGGISAGVNSLVNLVRGIDLPPPASPEEVDLAPLVPLFFFMIFLGAFLSTALGKILGTSASGLVALGISSIIASLGIAIPFALMCAAITFFSDSKATLRALTSGGSSRRSGYRGGGFSSGGGGGFGGGGSFSGGGASGRW
jgi:uncharacterized protein